MRVDLHYGNQGISLEIPEKNISGIIQPWTDDRSGDNSRVLREAFSPQCYVDFHNDIRGRSLCVMLSDGSRDMPFEDIFAQLFGSLVDCSKVRFMICCGTHNADTPENRAIIQQINHAASEANLTGYDVCVHDCTADQLIDAGKTQQGTNIAFNAKIQDAEIFLVLSDVKFHYFAGYSNPVKYFVPGICGFETAEQNHALSLDPKSRWGHHPWHRQVQRRSNPLAMDQLEGMCLIVGKRAVYALCTISSHSRIGWAGFGKAEEISGQAFSVADRRNARNVEPTEFLIVSPGGLPNDVDLYMSQRALELTKEAVLDGGEILFVSACPKGVGEECTMENFYDRLTQPIDDIFESIKGEYKLFSHKPYKFAELICRLNKIWIYSQISQEIVEAGHLYPTKNPQSVVDGWLREKPDAKIMIVDGANKIGLYAGGS